MVNQMFKIDQDTGEVLSNTSSAVVDNIPVGDLIGRKVSTVVYEEITESIRNLREFTDSAKWTIGDLVSSLVDGCSKKAAKEMIERLAKDTNIKPDTLAQYKWVSDKFPIGPVREISPILSYSHYRACAKVLDATSVLEMAASEGWTVNKLEEYIAIQKDTVRLEREGCSCDRPGCNNKVSLDNKERVSLQIFGYKFTFCGLSCAGNLIVNNLNQIKHSMLGDPLVPVFSSKTLLIEPVGGFQSLSEEEWQEKRLDEELAHIRKNYGNITIVK